ncbi:hypothetical protein J4212_00275 [Candidatus Woesearchaeota archaeon]|nr:hypothetical protein [Candidatus Woesearchaeota archaeon]
MAELIVRKDYGTSSAGLDSRLGDSAKIDSGRTFYDFATENLKGTMDILQAHYPKQIAGRILTINGSGDHVINFLAGNPAEVTGIDRSLVACLYSDMKIGILQAFSFDMFKGFFDYNTGDQGSLHFYNNWFLNKLNRSLDRRTLEFFGSICKSLRSGSEDEEKAAFQRLFGHMVSKSGGVKGAKLINCYLASEEAYKEFQGRARKTEIRLIADEMQSHLQSAEERYDVIHLSNIHDYCTREIVGIIELAQKRLAEEGILILYNNGGPVIKEDDGWRNYRVENVYMGDGRMDFISVFKNPVALKTAMELQWLQSSADLH